MRIGELANQLGVSADTLRFYEREGWLPRPVRSDNGYRSYRPDDVEHLRLMLELRRMDLPLDAAARLAGWCHSGHCDETTVELPRQLADRRRAIGERIDGLRQLDERLATLQRHLLSAAARSELTVLNASGPCCATAAAVSSADGTCACCANPVS